jgi:hypothetical protein
LLELETNQTNHIESNHLVDLIFLKNSNPVILGQGSRPTNCNEALDRSLFSLCYAAAIPFSRAVNELEHVHEHV